VKHSCGARVLVLPAPVWRIGTYDAEGVPNVMTVAWGGICCSEPPCVTVSLRKATYTYDCLMARQAYTVNVPSARFVKEADFFGIATGREVNKLEATGLTPVKGEFVDAPYIQEFPMVLECKVIHVHEIGLHTQFIGEILDVKVDESCLGEKGMPDMDLLQPFVFAPGFRAYYKAGGLLGRAFSVGRSFGKAKKE